uniref:Putative cytochrome P450 n=1 Tax=Eschscholzia californica subsp. californica TaxID=222997 RepID=A0A2Z6BXW0_ESCCA|nr:putative cytochrome P450 [Eschscholzia californica subsp. californica]
MVKNRKIEPPEVANGWPIIGHLHHFMGKKNKLIHEIFGDMADKYGPTFTLRMGLNKVLVVSSAEVAKECLTKNDLVFIGRPPRIASSLLGYSYAMFPFSPYGTYYNQMRKVVTHELLSTSRVESLKHVWNSEINKAIQELHHKVVSVGGSGPVLIEFKHWFADLTFRTTITLICGKQYFGTDGATPASMTSNGVFIDSLMEEWLEEHKRKRRLLNEADKKESRIEQDFMDVMISKLDDPNLLSHYDADTINKATCLTLILGGSDTTMVSLVWTLTLLMNHPHVLKKAQDELDFHVGRERQVEESDMKNLVYLHAVMKEAMRLNPAGTLSAPRMSTKDCTVSGYHVPAGTHLFMNTWKIQRDPNTWVEPTEFRPERFLTTHKDFDLKGQNFELLPFGSGRRSCLGANFALQVMRQTLARLLHGFDLKTPSDEPVDMTGSAGLINTKATPLEVLVTPRLFSM